MALSMEQIAARVDSLKHRNHERDARNLDVLAVRKGKIAEVYPDFFPDGVDANVVANFIDIVARDLSEVMAPLPAVNCSAANQVSDRARTFADKRTRIASNYFQHSDLAVQMYSGADWYITYGFVPFIIELDEEAKLPRIRIENPIGAYPEFDRYGRCVAFAKRYMMTLGELVSQFPDYERELLGGYGYKQDLNTQVEMIRYYDESQSVIYLPSKGNLVLSRANNPLGKMMVVVARKPSIDGELRGQFDDVLGIQLLRNRFALLAMEAAEKSVQAPIVLPQDVQELQLGGDAVIRTSNPAGVRRVDLNLPQGAFTEQQLLNQELRVGSRYPEGRTGNIDASIVTGQGVQALMGAFDTQVKSAQAIFAAALRDVISICFEVDEKIYPEEKTIRGVDSGSPYEITYKPTKDIKGDYSADVRYGMLAGLNPAQGLIFMLQALGGKLISRDMAMRELPFTVNVTQELEKIEIEDMRAALLGSLTAMTQAIPQMATQGQDPSEIVRNIAAVIKARQKGQALEDAIEATFAPQQPVPPAGAQQMVEQTSPAPAAAPAGGALAPEAPQAQPDIQTILSSLTASGKAGGRVVTRAQTKQGTMTTIIGIEYEDSCFLVADSQTTDDSGKIYSHPDVQKIAERGSFLVAGSGEVLPCDVAQHIWEPPTPTKKDRENLYHFMIAKAMPSLRKCLTDNGYNFDESKNESRFQFLITVCGEIFDIDQELCVSRSKDGMYAVGSGAAYALGALYAGADAHEAMEIAAKITAYTAGPYYSKTQIKHFKQEATMAENRGGFRPTAPQNNPANVSGTGGAGQSGTQPARYISGLGYGEGQATMAQQQSAPMAGAPAAPSMPAATPLFAPTERPNEPLTAGMDFGPGPGSEALNLPRERSLSEVLASMIDIDPTGEVQDLYNFVASRGL